MRKRPSHGFSFGAHYTWGKALSYAGGDTGATFTGDSSNSVQNFDDFKANKGPSTGGVTHSFAAEWLWELPKLQGWSAVPRALLGGWQLAGIFRAQTGAPLQVSEPSAISARRPDLRDPNGAVNQDYRQTLQYLSPSAFAVVPKSAVSGATLRPGTYGNNALRGPGFWLLDLSVARNFALPSTVRLQVRADVFNALNHVNYTGVVTNIEVLEFREGDGDHRTARGPAQRAAQLLDAKSRRRPFASRGQVVGDPTRWPAARRRAAAGDARRRDPVWRRSHRSRASPRPLHGPDGVFDGHRALWSGETFPYAATSPPSRELRRRFPGGRVFVFIGLWSPSGAAMPPEDFARAVGYTLEAGIPNLWITPNHLMTPAHWDALTRVLGRPGG